jgi:hypothetical protein
MAKFRERIKARKLRESGESIGVIAKNLGVSKGTVSLWCGDIQLTDAQKARLIERDKLGGAKGRLVANEKKKKERLERLGRLMDEGRRSVGKMTKRDLFVVGIALYWAEGNKKQRRLIFSNSDPLMIRIWIKWLMKYLGISKDDICCQVGINQVHGYRLKDVEQYWSKITDIPAEKFQKASLKRVASSKVYEHPEDHFGTLNVRVRRSTNFNYLMLGLIDGLGHFEAGS